MALALSVIALLRADSSPGSQSSRADDRRLLGEGDRTGVPSMGSLERSSHRADLHSDRAWNAPSSRQAVAKCVPKGGSTGKGRAAAARAPLRPTARPVPAGARLRFAHEAGGPSGI